MESQPRWKAKLALIFYIAVFGGTLIGSLIVGLILLIMNLDIQNMPFPFALLALPINESIILALTLLFARYKGAGLGELGLKKTSHKVLTIVSVAALPLIFLNGVIAYLETLVLGPDPTAELYFELVMPRNFFQLTALIIINLVLVGPSEELAYRGFVQRGFENSFGKTRSLLITSVLFGLWHILNTPYGVATAIAGGLILGYTWQRTGGNTTASALMHGVYNSIILAAVYFFA